MREVEGEGPKRELKSSRPLAQKQEEKSCLARASEDGEAAHLLSTTRSSLNNLRQRHRAEQRGLCWGCRLGEGLGSRERPAVGHKALGKDFVLSMEQRLGHQERRTWKNSPRGKICEPMLCVSESLRA